MRNIVICHYTTNISVSWYKCPSILVTGLQHIEADEGQGIQLQIGTSLVRLADCSCLLERAGPAVSGSLILRCFKQIYFLVLINFKQIYMSEKIQMCHKHSSSVLKKLLVKQKSVLEEVITTVQTLMLVFWIITPCVLGRCQRSGQI
jgi:hypothetical protein